MKSGHKGRSEQRKRKGSGKPAPTTLAGHRAFAPLLGLWGALLGGGVVMVLPYAMVERLLQGTLVGSWGQSAQAVLAGVLSLTFGLVLFAVAAAMHDRARRAIRMPSVAERVVRQVTPINPARDLGTRSLDEPLDTMPFTTPAWRDTDFDAPRRKRDIVPAAQPVAEETPEPVAPAELDLAQFAELPNRNAVWVEEAPEPVAVPEAEPAPEPAAETAAEAAPVQADPIADIRARRLRAVAPPPPAPGTAALARLRATPPTELSLVEMVERFAGALHEHRETPAARSHDAADLAAREAALAEALRALAALSGGTSAAPRNTPGQTPREEPLRAALAQLQPRRELSRGVA